MVHVPGSLCTIEAKNTRALSKPPIDRGSDSLPDALDAVPPAFRDEESIASFQLRFVSFALRRGTPDSLLEQSPFLTLHHFLAAKRSSAMVTASPQLPSHRRKHRLALIWGDQSHDFPPGKLNKQIRIRVAVKRSIRGRVADPHVGVVNVPSACLGHERRDREVIP